MIWLQWQILASLLAILSSCQAIGQLHERIHLIGESESTSGSEPIITPSEIVELQDETNWEYEPRIWTPDEVSSSWVEDLDELNAILAENSQHPLGFSLSNELPKWKYQQENNTNNSIKSRSYFWDSKWRRHYGKLEVDIMPAGQRQLTAGLAINKQDEQQCDQFRVDIRETVICDKQRCDKLDFEWPKYDNQLVVIETTRHGMRFHRSDYEILAPTTTKLHNQAAQSGAEQTNKIAPPPVKFDLFDLFKPKPGQKPPPWAIFQQSTTTSTTTASPPEIPTFAPTEAPPANDTTTTEAPISTEPSTTDDTKSTDTETTTATAPATEETSSSTTTTAAPVSEEDGTQTASSIRGDEVPAFARSADSNQTQFVTTFRVNTKRRKQTIIGFGGALSDSTCRNIKSLSPIMARNLMEDYYGPRGLRYTLARMTMGSSDFSTTPYTNNDQLPIATQTIAVNSNDNDDDRDPFDDRSSGGAGGGRHRQQSGSTVEGDDVEMRNFRLVDEDYEFKLPVARQAIATSQQKIKFFSSLWSPPIWMKNNSHIVHGYLKGDVYGPYYKALAELIVKWLEAYRKQGIEFWATTGLNEPVTGIKPFIFHNSLGITRQDYVTFIKLYLGPLLRQRGFANLKLIALDDNKGYAQQWVKALLDDKEVAQYVSGVGVHWYMNDEYENLNFLARDYPNKFILSTEACNGYLPFQVHTLPGNWDRGVAYMYDIIKLMYKNVAGWVDWNMALDLYGGPSWAKNNLDAPIIVNAERDEYYKSPMFYALGHFSRFVEPNSTRLDHRIAYAKYDYPVEAVAYLTPRDYIVIVVLNANHHKVPFRVIVDRQVIRVVDLKADSFSTIIFKLKKGRNI